MTADRPAAPGPRFSGRWIALLVAVSVVLCVAIAIAEGESENRFGNMGAIHFFEAESVWSGQGFARALGTTVCPDLFTRPVYTLVLAPVAGCLGRNWAVVRPTVAALQGAMNAFAALAIAWTLARAGAGRAARLAAWGIVLHPVLVSQAASLVDSALFTCAFVGAYAAVAALGDGVSRVRRLGAGAALGLAVLTRSTALMLVPALVRAVHRGHAALRARAVTAALVAAGACAVLAPWLDRNHELTGRWMLSTVDSVNLWMGNNANTRAFLDEHRSLDELPGREAFDASVILPVDEQIRRYDAGRAAATDFIRTHPGQAASLAVTKAGDLWSVRPTPRSTRSGLHGLKDVVAVLWTVPLYAFALFGAFAAWRAGGAQRAFALDVALIALSFTAPHALAWGGTRLRAPLDPFLVAVAAIGVAAAWDRLRRATPPARAT